MSNSIVRSQAPTREFDAFVHDCAIAHLQLKSPEPKDLFLRRLWSAAEFDWHRQTGEVQQLLDAAGKPHSGAYAYVQMIETALNAISPQA